MLDCDQGSENLLTVYTEEPGDTFLRGAHKESTHWKF